MPIYEFKCKDCGRTFEMNLPMSRSGEKQICPYCQSKKTMRVFSPVSIGSSSLPDMDNIPSACPGGACGLQ